MIDFSKNNQPADTNSRAGFADQFFKVSLFRKGFLSQDQYDEPTYLTFYIDFDFDGMMTDSMTSLSASPLFSEGQSQLSTEIKTSASEYLDTKYSGAVGDYLRDFKNTLKYITNNTPWYFQSISGIDKMWSNITDGLKDGYIGGTDLTIGCLESIDLRILHLAEFYQKAAYDNKYMRHQLTDNLRHFNMKIYIGEVRDIYSLSPGVYSNPNGGDLIVGAARNITGRPDPLTTQAGGSPDSQYRLNSFYFTSFDCYQCEFDFSSIFNSSGSKINASTDRDPYGTSFKIKVGRFEVAGQFGPNNYSSNLYRDKYLNSGDKAALSASLADNITSAQRLQLQQENFTIEKLAQSLGPFAQTALSKVLGAERSLNSVLRAPSAFVNSAISEVQKSVEKGSLGSIYPPK